MRAHTSNFLRRFHELAVAKGWWPQIDQVGGKYIASKEEIEKVIPEKLMLVVSELSEALEAYREGKIGLYHVDGKPEGFAVELGDAIIRICDLYDAVRRVNGRIADFANVLGM